MGGIGLAQKVIATIHSNKNHFRSLYNSDDSIPDKIKKIVRIVYGGKGAVFTDQAKKQVENFQKLGWDKLPICMAKTQYSFSDNPTLIGRPRDFEITVRELRPSLEAGFIVAITGDMMTMPGLPKQPAALHMDIDKDGNLFGLS